MITMKYILLGCFAISSLMGMNHPIKYHYHGHHYAQAGEPYLVRGSFMEPKTAYPMFVRQASDNKHRAQFNFDNPISSMQWDRANLDMLCITLNDGRKHEFILDHLQLSERHSIRRAFK